MSKKPWYTRKHLAIDFNGVICTDRQAYQEGRITGTIRNEAWRAIKLYLDHGYKIIIQTARHDLDQVKLWMLFEERKASKSGIVCRLEFAHKPMAFLSIDDRAFTFCGTFPTTDEIDDFRAWQQPENRENERRTHAEISETEALPSMSHESIEATQATILEESTDSRSEQRQ